VERIRQGAILHDIGKIGVPEAILTKKGRLTDDEFATIKLHPSIGDSIVEPMGLNPWIRACIRNHHERWDGRGYPDALKGDQNLLPAHQSPPTLSTR
jgi:HD-GYP domain-containing protein (c-di-GMP phosphodiesterase class II)